MRINKRTVLAFVFVLVTLGAAFAALQPDSEGTQPTVEDANKALDSITSLALTGNPKEVCSYSTSELACLNDLEEAGPPPVKPPKILCSMEYLGNDQLAAGIAFKLGGELPDGTVYESTLLALELKEGVRFVNAVFWANSSISVGVNSGEVLELDCE